VVVAFFRSLNGLQSRRAASTFCYPEIAPASNKSVMRKFFEALLSLLILILSVTPCVANVPGGGAAGPDVTLQDSGSTVVLANGIISATIFKSSATIASLKFRGYEMSQAGYYSMDGGNHYRIPRRCIYSVKTQSRDMIDIGMKSVWRNEAQAFDIEVHYVLHRGASGLYSYAVLSHPANYPATGVGEWRMVWKLSPDLLEKIYVDDLRHWAMPNSEDFRLATRTPITEIIKINTGVRAGMYDCKYDYSANYWDLGCWGHASDERKVGAWIVLGSHEFFNDGPTKQDLTAASGIIHLHFGLDHYNASGTHVAAGEAWQKIFGPFLLYCNYIAGGGDACWADAQAQAKAEQAVWPYAWLTGIPAYPSANGRGSIAGHLIVEDALKPNVNAANAWLGVAQPEPGGNWQFESRHYQYWVKADSQGNFRIPNVRPGTYTLYAFTDGAVGEFSRPDVMVQAGATTALGDLTWNVPHKGTRIAWEIGVPDRTAKEFRHGNDYFHGYLWHNFTREFSNPLDYTVGKSNWKTDWNYVQTRYAEPDGKNAAQWKWRIHFNFDRVPAGAATLTMAIASAYESRIDVRVNDDNRVLTSISPSIEGGNALLREGIHAKYCVEYVSIPAANLKAGENIITLSIPETGSDATHVMYDYLNLELP
jgi:rhamnogalacturonan endolyase